MGTLKIGLISDTHVPTRARVLPAKVYEVFQDADHIFHAGDYVQYSVIEELQTLAPVTGCYGNMDPTSLKNKLPKVAIIKIANRIIKVIHDLAGSASGKEVLTARPVDIIMHGHTHKATVKQEKDLFIINPRSATNAFMRDPSIGILYLSENAIDYEIIKVR